ncbi:MAG: hypothetical protein QOG93_1601, partial [Gaiellaceae bacterium]|nr:hypothetical protein [Gaiellaceae bacterium]
MQSLFASGPGRRIALATGLVVAFLGLAIGVTTWRYEHAHSEGDKAIETAASRVTVQR